MFKASLDPSRAFRSLLHAICFAFSVHCQSERLLGSAIDTAADSSPTDVTTRDGTTETDTSTTPDYCASLPSLSGPFTIDGDPEPGLRLAPLVPAAWVGSDGGVPPNVNATFAIAWRPDGLYFFLSVVDPDRSSSPLQTPLFCNPGVELYADDDGTYRAPPSYDNPGSNHFIVVAPQADTADIAAGSLGRGAEPTLSAWQSTNFRAFPRPGGYTVEAVIVATDLGLPSWSLGVGDRVGFDLAVNVGRPRSVPPDPGCPDRLGQYVLHATAQQCTYDCNFPWRTVEAFCNPILALQ